MLASVPKCQRTRIRPLVPNQKRTHRLHLLFSCVHSSLRTDSSYHLSNTVEYYIIPIWWRCRVLPPGPILVTTLLRRNFFHVLYLSSLCMLILQHFIYFFPVFNKRYTWISRIIIILVIFMFDNKRS